MRNNFLLEILTEEMPYRFIPNACAQLELAFCELLKSYNLAFEEIKVYATPRRLAVAIDGLEAGQEDVEKTLKGPVLNMARDPSGKLTPQGLGFAKKNGVLENELYEEDGYIWAKVKQSGKSTKEILAQNAESIVLKLQGPYFMRWGHSDIKFSRPIENVLALFNDDVLPLTIAAKTSGRSTLGHRFSKHKEIKIKSPESYLKQLEEGNVIADPKVRKARIVELAAKKAEEVGAVIKFENYSELLDEITYITEYPVPVLCDFDEKYLEIPDIVTTVVMIKHQRYFPLYSKDGKLLNKFITMANFVGEDEESFKNIRAGNQRVVVARLDDGIFFYREDTKNKLEAKLEDLRGITFQKGLGSLYDKTMRIVMLSKYICETLDKNPEDTLRAALLSKCDLASCLVFEFTELQGFIGSDYARVSGENENVSTGVLEHYYPLNATSELAKSAEGQIVGIADKVDTVCAVFLTTQGDKKKKRPTGSQDPLGVRRAVLGILRTIASGGLEINLLNIIEKACHTLCSEFSITLEPETLDEIKEYFISRLISLLSQDSTYRADVLEACTKNTGKGVLEDLSDYISRVQTVSALVKGGNFTKFSENAVRVIKITNHTTATPPDEALLTTQEEKELYRVACSIKQSESHQALAADLLGLAHSVDSFFERTLVMDEDENTRKNRIALLNFVKEKFGILCDFSKIVKGQ
ncbi:glycyl-tRNA synthetase beta chain [Candidatus Gastranaerophilus sp. (ex Termes propinquus)]|nr:glycyl-tRNA synthetase beta chain [Candidatus Gastranaerophilus sp. (ex Termes propinquus)]